jgi:hypothetical protein
VSLLCPDGHDSTTTDYCDVCGARLEDADEPRPGTADDLGDDNDRNEDEDEDEPATDQIVDRAAPGDVEECPICATPRSGSLRFCENCGYDFLTGGNAATRIRWEAVVTADRAYYESLDTGGVEFPSSYAPRRFPLDGDEILIGRRSAGRGIEPSIDLGGDPRDDAVSHRHAMLRLQADGTYAVVDLGSANGTFVDGSTEPIATDEEIRLRDGSRVHIGAWTMITICAVVDGEG